MISIFPRGMQINLGRAGRLAALLLAAGVSGFVLPVHAQGGGSEFARGHILVKFKDNQDEAAQNAAAASIRAQGRHRLGNLNVQQVDIAAGDDEISAVKRLKARPEVEFAELDAKVSGGAITTNDPFLGSQWNLASVSAPAAWALAPGSATITIAILDSGCDPTHPDLTANYIPGWNFFDNNSNTADVNGHGTAVAGCAGAVNNNASGIASVSGSSKIMPVRIADANAQAYYSTIAQGMQWAVNNGAQIVNCSYVNLSGSATIVSAAQYIFNHGGLFVTCAGNDNADPGYSSSPYIIVVSGTDSSDSRSSFSDYGNFVTAAAPATSILTTTNGGGYGYWSGTSFAAPLAASVLALTWSANPHLSNSQVRDVLTQSVDDLGAVGWDPYFGYGKVNAYKAVLLAQSIAVDITPPTVAISNLVNGSVVSGTSMVALSAGDNVGVTRVDLWLDGAVAASVTTSTATIPWDTSKVANGTHALCAKAYDAAGNVGVSSTITVAVRNAQDTAPPTCAFTSPSSGAAVNKNITVTISAGDNVGVASVTLYLDGAQVGCDASAPYTFTLNTQKWSVGAHTLTAVACDAAGNKSVPASLRLYR